MKFKLITLTAISALSLGTAFAQTPSADQPANRGGRGFRHNGLQQMTDSLNLTPDQKAKVQPIIDQATPQIEQIRREAMQKTKTVMNNALAQIRPLLTPDQQKQLDASQGNRGGRHGRRGQNAQDPADDPGDQ